MMKKDLVWQAVDFRRGRTSCRPAAEIRRRCEITHGILRKQLNAKVIIEHGTTKVEVERRMRRLGLIPGAMKKEVR